MVKHVEIPQISRGKSHCKFIFGAQYHFCWFNQVLRIRVSVFHFGKGMETLGQMGQICDFMVLNLIDNMLTHCLVFDSKLLERHQQRDLLVWLKLFELILDWLCYCLKVFVIMNKLFSLVLGCLFEHLVKSKDYIDFVLVGESGPL